jgi:hypothetical protein
MGLEFLLRRTPPWREVAEGILLREGDIVEQGQEAEERAVEGATARGALVTGSASLVSPCRTPSGRDADGPCAAMGRNGLGAEESADRPRGGDTRVQAVPTRMCAWLCLPETSDD